MPIKIVHVELEHEIGIQHIPSDLCIPNARDDIYISRMSDIRKRLMLFIPDLFESHTWPLNAVAFAL